MSAMRIPAKIGAVQIESSVVRLAVVRAGGRGPQVLDLVECEVRDDSDTSRVAALREAAGRLNAHPSVWVLVVPASWSVLRLLSVPFRSARKVAAAVPFELEPTLAMPIETLVIDHLIARAGGGETQVLAVGVRRDGIAAHADLAAQAGLQIEGAYLDAVALTSMWATGRRRSPGAQAVLHFRPNEAQLAVIENGRLAYLRRLDSEPRDFRAAPGSVAREVRNLLRAYTADVGSAAAIDSLAITGAQLHEAGRTIFESELDVMVRYEELAAGVPGYATHVSAPDAVSDEFNRWSAPVAAALNAAGGPFHLNVLRRGAGETPRAQKQLARSLLSACVAGAVVLLAYLSLVLMDYRHASRELEQYGDAIWNEFQAAYPDLALTRPPNDLGGAESYRLLQDAALAESSSSLNVPLDVFSAPPLLEVLLDISTALDPKVADVEEISIRPLRQYREVLLRGRVLDSARYNDAVEKLDASRLLQVNRDQSTRITEGGRETFTLRARM